MVHSNFQMTYKLSFWHNYIDVYILFAGIPVPFEISPLLGGLIGVVTALLFITIAIPIAMKIRNERRTQRPSDLPLKKSTAPSSEDLYDTEDRNPDVVPINKGIYTRIYIILCETYQLMGDRMWYAHLCYCKYFFFFFFFFFFLFIKGQYALSTSANHQRPHWIHWSIWAYAIYDHRHLVAATSESPASAETRATQTRLTGLQSVETSIF